MTWWISSKELMVIALGDIFDRPEDVFLEEVMGVEGDVEEVEPMAA